MDVIVPYLMFNENAAEAIVFYNKALSGTVVSQQSFDEVPMESQVDHNDKIMHATFKPGDLSFMVSDSMPGQLQTTGISLSMSLNFQDVESIETIFAVYQRTLK